LTLRTKIDTSAQVSCSHLTQFNQLLLSALLCGPPTYSIIPHCTLPVCPSVRPSCACFNSVTKRHKQFIFDAYVPHVTITYETAVKSKSNFKDTRYYKAYERNALYLTNWTAIRSSTLVKTSLPQTPRDHENLHS